MTVDDIVFPFEFFLAGTPVSLQANAKSVSRWKAQVEAAARQRRDETVDWAYLKPEPLAATIYYFPIEPMVGDLDNIVKPILDALIGVVYLDDDMIERMTVQKFEPAVNWTISAPSEQLAAALQLRSASESLAPVVYLHLANDLRWRRS